MSLEIQLHIEKTTLLCQENPVCRIVITNTGDQTAMVANPRFNPDVPIIRVVEIKTGIEALHHGKPLQAGPAFQAVEKGQKIEHSFGFASIACIHLPAEYEISAIVPYDLGAKRAESKPVKVKIVGVTPRGLAMVNVQGGWAAVQYGVSVNASSDPPQIIRYKFHVMAEGGVEDARPVANAHLRASPLISVSPNRRVAHVHWIAWIEEGAMAFTQFDAEHGSRPTGRWKPAEPEFVPVAPLVTEPVPKSGGRPAGAALVWVGDAARHLSALQSVEFGNDGRAVAGGRCELGGPRPEWMMNHVRSDGARLVTYAVSEPQGTVLFGRPWPKPGASGEARRLAIWPGQCHGGGATIDDEDSIRGATLMRGHARDGAKLELATWKWNRDNAFVENQRQTIAWDYNTPVGQTLVRVDPNGRAVALLTDNEGRWYFYDGHGTIKPLPNGLDRTSLPVDVTFFSKTNPVLVVGKLTQGFALILANGEPLPHLCG